MEDWLSIEKEVVKFLGKQTPPKPSDQKMMADLLADGYRATMEEDGEIMKDFEAPELNRPF